MARPTVAPAHSPNVRDDGFGPRTSRPRLWAEISLIAICYSTYSLVRNLVPTQHAAAVARANEILAAERFLHLDIERAINQVFVQFRWLGVAANYYYATLHFVVTIGVLVWLYVRRPHLYAAYRRLLFCTTVIALLGFWLFPLAPPRFLPGYVDTVLVFHTWGLYDSSPIATVSNQYAAMPSLHTAWSLWCGLTLISTVRSRWIKMTAAGYPLITVIVILGTSNHFILDAFGGVAVLAGGHVLVQARTWAIVPVHRLCRRGAEA